MENTAYLSGVQQGSQMVGEALDRRRRRIELQSTEAREKRREQQVQTNEDRRYGLDLERNEREKKKQAEDDLDRATDRKRKDKVGEELDIRLEIQKDEMKRYLTAKQAWGNYQSAIKEINWGDPGAPDAYQRITQSYLPEIATHDGVRKQWEAFDKVTQQNSQFQAITYARQAKTAAVQQASKDAPWLLYDPPKKADGTPDAKAFAEQLKQAQADKIRATIEAREAYYGTRSGATSRPVADSPEVKSDRMLLNKLREKMIDLSEKGARDPNNPQSEVLADQYRRLQDEERRISERIKSAGGSRGPSVGAGPPGREAPGAPVRGSQPGFDANDPLGLGGNSGSETGSEEESFHVEPEE